MQPCPSPGLLMLEIEFAQLTDVGSARENNEDGLGYWPHADGVVFAVADGLGGFDCGEVASAVALATFGREMTRAPRDPARWPVARRLWSAVQQANLAVYDRRAEDARLRSMGTTLTATALIGSTVVVAHVGDCRLLRIRDGSVSRLTKDHNRAWQQVALGLLSPEQARRHPDRHVLTRSLGPDPLVRIDMLTAELQAGDVFVQCSDGVHTLVSERDIAAVIEAAPPEGACQALIERARAAGGDDNVSVQVAAVTACVEVDRDKVGLLERLTALRVWQASLRVLARAAALPPNALGALVRGVRRAE
jgi:PPM family protein phosphatase